MRKWIKYFEDFSSEQEASTYIKRFGLASNTFRWGFMHPTYVFLNYEHLQKLKDLNVRYKIKKIKDLNLNSILSDFIKQSTGETNGFIDGGLFFYNKNYMNIEEIEILKEEIENILEEFNKMIGTLYYIEDIKTVKSFNSEKTSIINKLKGIEDNSTIYYKEVYFILNRECEKEDEYLISVEIEDDHFKIKNNG